MSTATYSYNSSLPLGSKGSNFHKKPLGDSAAAAVEVTYSFKTAPKTTGRIRAISKNSSNSSCKSEEDKEMNVKGKNNKRGEEETETETEEDSEEEEEEEEEDTEEEDDEEEDISEEEEENSNYINKLKKINNKNKMTEIKQNESTVQNVVGEKDDEEVEDDDDEDDNDDEDEEDEEDDEEEETSENESDETDDEEDIKNKTTTRKYKLSDFEIIKTVGTGTFGRVCLCRDRVSERYLAMKILAMADVIRLRQTEHVIYERNILREIKHPFMISLEWSTKDSDCLYMIFEYVCGGELFSYLRNAGKFTSQTANYYTAEIVLALEYLHELHIVYRDLKPENLLLNRHGHIKITDFGFAKKLRDRTWTLCGTPEYLAPEIIQNKGHNKAVDWWALGVLIYEMLSGYPPFYDENPFGIYEKILGGKIEWPKHMDLIAKDLIKKLLTSDRTKRLGNMKNGANDVKRHRWFQHLNWNDVYSTKLEPPIIPNVKFDGDTSNFDDYPDKDWKPPKLIDQKDYTLFKDF